MKQFSEIKKEADYYMYFYKQQNHIESPDEPRYNVAFYPAFRTVLNSQSLLYYYIECNKMIADHIDRAITCFDINSNDPNEPDYREPRVQLDIIKAGLDTCAEEIIGWMSLCYPTCYCTKKDLMPASNLLQKNHQLRADRC